ncbi:alpha-L RNA-binding motif-containing protein [Dothidotthia symphoricarpi CBS 119687]|uniref:Alpha-L RNA-binding motif-containing protein n=1 Tax=Dothidotthia symphoricarpi CBS 119687 TaxID=1392245 RepID=A0A6A6A7D4_9PLEO|nr:alpha-L RNA-binding motif-containing protein [Dothidotthia symphoricarpi CBS 119687]KAF2127769.1 alpha-L RNA-binding motif-containing protein [Dothidotthia symphoricarpi CBS 119687]
MRKKPRFHSLKKLKVRQDWSRWTLYSLAQLKAPNVVSRTYFQQKWTAKADTRAYHGEQIREKKWRRLFKRSLPAVVPMDHKYLARYDGSEQAAGRGAGADTVDRERTPPMTPYMQMAYYPVERRLDTAIFRSLFSSSVRQARQFCVHGLVRVNGKKMPYPGYMLNPGDMFQVEPSSVMFATGAQKERSNVARRVIKEKAAERAAAREASGGQTPRQPAEPAVSRSTREEPTAPELKKHLQAMMEHVDDVLAEDVKAKDKQKFRAFRQTVKKAISLWRSANPETVSTLDTQFDFLKQQLADRSAETSTPEASEPLISPEDTARLRSAFEKLRLEAEHTSVWNGRNRHAPYATPWRPRDYMSAFAFIPRYLEVNQNICAAVYLRHPVARPGLAEVPTPFHVETGQLAFNWYLRRR